MKKFKTGEIVILVFSGLGITMGVGTLGAHLKTKTKDKVSATTTNIGDKHEVNYNRGQIAWISIGDLINPEKTRGMYGYHLDEEIKNEYSDFTSNFNDYNPKFLDYYQIDTKDTSLKCFYTEVKSNGDTSAHASKDDCETTKQQLANKINSRTTNIKTALLYASIVLFTISISAIAAVLIRKSRIDKKPTK